MARKEDGGQTDSWLKGMKAPKPGGGKPKKPVTVTTRPGVAVGRNVGPDLGVGGMAGYDVPNVPEGWMPKAPTVPQAPMLPQAGGGPLPPVPSAVPEPRIGEKPLAPWLPNVGELRGYIDPAKTNVTMMDALRDGYLDITMGLVAKGLNKAMPVDADLAIDRYISNLGREGLGGEMAEIQRVPTPKVPGMVLDVLNKWAVQGKLLQWVDDLPERAFWVMQETGSWAHLSLPGAFSSGPSVFESAMIADMIGSPIADENLKIVMGAVERSAGVTSEDLGRLWNEGQISYTFLMHPETVQAFRDDVAGGMSVDRAVEEHANLWEELVGEVLFSPMNLLGPLEGKATKFLWPGFVAVEGALKGVVRVGGKVLGKIPVADWLVAMSKTSLLRGAVRDSQDAFSELLVVGGGEDVVKLVDGVISGDMSAEVVGQLSDITRGQLSKVSDLLSSKGIRNIEQMVKRFLPDLAENLGDEAAEFLGKHPEYLTYVVGKAAEEATAEVLGLSVKQTPFKSFYNFARGLWKEHLLGLNPAYLIGNLSDNTVKSWLSGYMINPLKFSALTDAGTALAEFGTVLPQGVAQGLVSEVIEEGGSKMGQLPIPGIGKPSEIAEFWGRLFGAKTPSTLWPSQSAFEKLVGDTSSRPGIGVRFLDKLNVSSLVELSAGFSNNIEQTARVGIFTRAFENFLADDARPALLNMAQGLGIEDNLLARVKSPADIMKLVGDNLANMPQVNIGSLMPEGLEGDIFDALDGELRSLQDFAMGTDPQRATEIIGKFGDLVDDLFGKAKKFVDVQVSDANVQKAISSWETFTMTSALDDLLQKRRGLADSLRDQAWAMVKQYPERAGSVWPKYFDRIGTLQQQVMSDVHRIVSERAPTLSDELAALFSKHADDAADSAIPALSYEDWGEFGEKLLQYREGLDSAIAMGYNKVIKEPTEATLGLLDEAFTEIGELSKKASDAASVLRDGFIKQGGGTEKGARITYDKYKALMDGIWNDEFFKPASDVFTSRFMDAGIEELPTSGFGEVLERMATGLGKSGLEDDAVSKALELIPTLQDGNIDSFQALGELLLPYRSDPQVNKVLWDIQRMAESWHMADLGDDLAGRLNLSDKMVKFEEWQQAIKDQVGDLLSKRQMDDDAYKSLRGKYQELAGQWANQIERAKEFGLSETNRLLFDYAHKTNIEEVLGYAYPFTTWQLRNPFMWLDLAKRRPAVIQTLRKYLAISEEERTSRGMTARFEYTLPIPFQDKLQEMGILPEGSYLSFDPSGIVSALSQGRTPFTSPEEENMTGWQALVNQGLRMPERLGITPYPWLQMPLEQAGAYGNRPGSGLMGPVGRAVPALRRADMELSQARVQGSDWLQNYNYNRQLAFMLQEGRITSEQAMDAVNNPDSEVWQMAKEEILSQQDKLSTWRTGVPVSLKYAAPGEVDLRAERERLKTMGPNRAAFLRKQNPAQTVYSRAIAGVESPEWARWSGKRDVVYNKYDKLLADLSPWDKTRGELMQQRQAELDALGEEPEQVSGAGYAPEGKGGVDKQTILWELYQGRPKAQDFTNARGDIDWEAYGEKIEAYKADIGKMTGELVNPEEYAQYSTRFQDPAELAWNMRKDELSKGWDRYGALKEQKVPKGWLPTPQGLEGNEPWNQEARNKLNMMNPQTDVAPETQQWLDEEVQRRRGAGWSDQEIGSWASEQGIPFERIQAILKGEGYGEKPLGEMQGGVERLRPWLQGQGMESPEWGSFGKWAGQEMPGVLTEETSSDKMRSQYYDMMPTQQRDFREMLSIGDDEDLSTWFDDPANLERVRQMSRDVPVELFSTPSNEERMQAEREMAQWSLGGQWTPLLDKYFSDPNSSKSKFWDYVNEMPLVDEAYDDPQLTAMLGWGSDMFKYTDEQYQKALDYLDKHPELVNQELIALREEYPEWWKEAQGQATAVQYATDALPDVYDTYQRLRTPKARKEWRAENPDLWEQVVDTLDANNAAYVQNPFYTYFHKPDKYKEWWGDTPPDEIDVEADYESFREAVRESELQREQGGDWTPAMERWFGDSDSPSSKFWTKYFNMKYYLKSEYHDDDVLSAALSSDVRDLILSEDMDALFEEATARLGKFYDKDTFMRFSGQPAATKNQAFGERSQFLSEFDYDAIPTDKEGEDAWWKNRTTFMKGHPVMTYFFYYNKYLQWWGDTPLGSAGALNQGGPIDKETFGQPSGSTGGGGGGGGGTPPPPPNMPVPPPPPPPPQWLP